MPDKELNDITKAVISLLEKQADTDPPKNGAQAAAPTTPQPTPTPPQQQQASASNVLTGIKPDPSQEQERRRQEKRAVDATTSPYVKPTDANMTPNARIQMYEEERAAAATTSPYVKPTEDPGTDNTLASDYNLAQRLAETDQNIADEWKVESAEGTKENIELEKKKTAKREEIRNRKRAEKQQAILDANMLPATNKNIRREEQKTAKAEDIRVRKRAEQALREEAQQKKEATLAEANQNVADEMLPATQANFDAEAARTAKAEKQRRTKQATEEADKNWEERGEEEEDRIKQEAAQAWEEGMPPEEDYYSTEEEAEAGAKAEKAGAREESGRQREESGEAEEERQKVQEREQKLTEENEQQESAEATKKAWETPEELKEREKEEQQDRIDRNQIWWRDRKEYSRQKRLEEEKREESRNKDKKPPRKTSEELAAERREQTAEKRQTRREEVAGKRKEKDRDASMEGELNRMERGGGLDTETREAIESLTQKKGKISRAKTAILRGKQGVEGSPNYQQNRDVIQNFLRTMPSGTINSPEGKEWLESVNSIKTNDEGEIIIDPDSPSSAMWEQFNTALNDAAEKGASRRKPREDERLFTPGIQQPQEIPEPVEEAKRFDPYEHVRTTPAIEENKARTRNAANVITGRNSAPELPESDRTQTSRPSTPGATGGPPSQGAMANVMGRTATPEPTEPPPSSSEQDVQLVADIGDLDVEPEQKDALNNIIEAAGPDSKNEARSLVQWFMNNLRDNDDWNEWFDTYTSKVGSGEEQLDPFNAAMLASAEMMQESQFQNSADGLLTKAVTSILQRLDNFIHKDAFVSEVPPIKIVFNDDFYKASQVLKGLSDLLVSTETDKRPPLHLFDKQDEEVSLNRLGNPRPFMPTESQAAARPTGGGHKGVPGKWSGAHLVPMYRTVHRQKPRELVLRAIRWVNPDNFFKATNGKAITELSDDEWREMGRDELIKNITTLNEYREESLVISNRYDEMIVLIDGAVAGSRTGQTPYAILWNDPDKWMTLNDRMDRAEGLKQGASAWEDKLDRTAIKLQRVLGEEKFNTETGEKSHFGMIDDLFDEEKGRIPFFKKVGKAGQDEDKPWLRVSKASKAQTRFQPGTGKQAPEATPIARSLEEGIRGLRATRYQLPSMRESLNPTIQEIASGDFIEIMRQAPIYEGLTLPSEEQLLSEDRLEMTRQQIQEVAPDYTQAEESPFLRTPQNPFGHWQEDAGVDATTVRSTRFVAETLKLTAPEELEVQQPIVAEDDDSNLATPHGTINATPENINNAASFDSDEENDRWKDSAGMVVALNLSEAGPGGSLAIFHGPPGGAVQAESAYIAATIDAELNMLIAPLVKKHIFEGTPGYVTNDSRSFLDAFSLTMGKEGIKAFSKPAYRKGFYKMMLLDAMCGNSVREGTLEYSRDLPSMGFDEAAAPNFNQWRPVVMGNMFSKLGNQDFLMNEGGRALFPWNIFKDDPSIERADERERRSAVTRAKDETGNFEFNSDLLPVQKPYGYKPLPDVDYEKEIREVVDEAMPKMDAGTRTFNRPSRNENNDDLWEDLGSRVMNVDGYNELKDVVVKWMTNQMNTADAE